jgi:multidrug efflux system membrane fusion protein
MTARIVGVVVVLGTVVAAVPSAEAADPAARPRVPVSAPVQRQVTDYAQFNGRAEAVESIELRPRVTGYIVRTPFKEGAMVKKGDVLFEIDPRPYQAQLDQAEAEVGLAQADLRLAKTTLARDRAQAKTTPGSVSAQQLDQDQAAVEAGSARVKARQAAREIVRFNLDFTRVVSPINGQVGRALRTEGNLARQDETTLTTVVSLDPMYVYFDMDQGTLLRLRRAINEGKIRPPAPGQVQIGIGLPGEDGFPHQGLVDFVNNQVERNTQAIIVRATLPNPQPPGGVRLLTPGMGAHVRVPLGPPHAALLVSDQAVATDQRGPLVFVVDGDGKVHVRRVTQGELQEDGLRVVEGLKPGDRVVVGGLRGLHPGLLVEPEATTMPVRGKRAQ